MNVWVNALLWLVVVSALEWGIHKHIMHGDPEALRATPVLGSWLAQTAQTHNDHHLDVDNDMRIPHDTPAEGLYFSWGSTVPMFVAATAIMLALNSALGGPGPLHTAAAGAVLTVVFSFVWNSVHARMHEHPLRVRYTDGVPSVEGIPQTLGPLYTWMWRNHALHHMQKGGHKGNYNIIVPGFDLLMGTHTAGAYDNREYCSRTDDPRCGEPQGVRGSVALMKVLH